MGTPNNGSSLSQAPPNNVASTHAMPGKHNPITVTTSLGTKGGINHRTTMNNEKLTYHCRPTNKVTTTTITMVRGPRWPLMSSHNPRTRRHDSVTMVSWQATMRFWFGFPGHNNVNCKFTFHDNATQLCLVRVLGGRIKVGADQSEMKF